MANLEAPRRGTDTTSGTYVLGPGTLVAAAIAVCLAQVALAMPAVLNGRFQQDLGTTSSQLTWISDAFLVPVCLLELSFGVLGDLFGRKRLLVGGALVLAVGEAIAVLTPGRRIVDGDPGAGAVDRPDHRRCRRGGIVPHQPGHGGRRHPYHPQPCPLSLALGGGAVVRRGGLTRARRAGGEGEFRRPIPMPGGAGRSSSCSPWRWPARA